MNNFNHTFSFPQHLQILVHYADDDLAVVEKPPNVLSVPGRGEAKQYSMVSYLQNQLGKAVYVVHRLDMSTSGLMVFALNGATQKQLNHQFAQRQTHKQYTAHLMGKLSQHQGHVACPLITDWLNRPRQKVCFLHGKWSLTQWQVMEQWQQQSGRDSVWVTKVLYTPITGRSHQLRLHSKCLGHPILGDELYGDVVTQQCSPNRLQLHANHLSFIHPKMGSWLRFDSPVVF